MSNQLETISNNILDSFQTIFFSNSTHLMSEIAYPKLHSTDTVENTLNCFCVYPNPYVSAGSILHSAISVCLK
jgi:hypothetical protein